MQTVRKEVTMHKALIVFLLVAGAAGATLLGGCGRGSGLPSDLIGHLARQGISITPTRVHAPLSSRGGYVVAQHSASVAANIITTFKLQRMTLEDAHWVIERAEGLTGVKEIWGVADRPAQFRLRGGGQFQYFYLIITEDGFMYLVAEYAYG
jgi:hypothetical protein